MPKKQLVEIKAYLIGEVEMNAVNARDLWLALESKQDFSDWIKNRIEKYGFVENEDYLLHKFMEQVPSGAKYKIDYILTTGMARELAMLESNVKGREVRKYFIEVEKELISKNNINEHYQTVYLGAIQQSSNVIFHTGYTCQSYSLMLDAFKIYTNTIKSEEPKAFFIGMVERLETDLEILFDQARTLISIHGELSEFNSGSAKRMLKTSNLEKAKDEIN